MTFSLKAIFIIVYYMSFIQFNHLVLYLVDEVAAASKTIASVVPLLTFESIFAWLRYESYILYLPWLVLQCSYCQKTYAKKFTTCRYTWAPVVCDFSPKHLKRCSLLLICPLASSRHCWWAAGKRPPALAFIWRLLPEVNVRTKPPSSAVSM